jgi:Peptidase family C25
MTTPLLYCNGINGKTGEYVFPPATPKQIAAFARGDSVLSEGRADTECWLQQGAKGPRTGDPRDLTKAGWGVIFAQNDPQADAVLAALRELLALRKSQVGQKFEHRYQEYVETYGYKTGESKRQFLTRHRVGAGAADPDKMPYYLLIVGGPEMIPWEFQYELDTQYAVGRLWFETAEEYKRYAATVVAAETSPRVRAKRAVVFAPQHAGDPPTDLTRQHLAAPLADRIERAEKGWTVDRAFGDEATKANLKKMLNGGGPPDLLFTAGHGLWLPSGDDRQRSLMGALVCQDWPGPGCGYGPMADQYFGADDVNGAKISGLVSFHFGCYSAGVPSASDFDIEYVKSVPEPFVSLMPRRLLQTGALAVIGHVDCAWQCSIDFPGAGHHIEVFEDFVDHLLLRGHPVGSAMESFGMRFAELSRDLGAELEEERRGKPANDSLLSELWLHSRDARNYVVLGDPAVRLVPPEGEP